MTENHYASDFPPIGTILPSWMRNLLAAVLILLILSLLAGALAIPFLFESPSMWYKSGMDRVLLRTGKMLGIAAGLLLLFQLALAGRLKLLDRIFSLPALIRQHRFHAWIIALIAMAHPVCVLIPEDKLIVPLEMRYWPEWIGVALLVLVLFQFVTSRWRGRLKIAFHIWMRFHRIAGFLIIALLIVHVLYVSETFEVEGLPHTAALLAAGVFLLIWLWIRTGWLWRSHPFTVASVESTGIDCTCVELQPANQSRFVHIPGQFAFVSFRSDLVTKEPHLFTLSSTPSRPGMLQFTIRASGDWTRTVRHLSKGIRARILGPFGRFGHLFTERNRELIMIAGGIGITPMLSMLRFMADQCDPRPVTLIWSNRSREHVVFSNEMDNLSAKLTGLRWIPIFTHKTETGNRAERLNRHSLEKLLRNNNRGSAVFLCGPPQMMIQVKADLRSLGFPINSIFTEEFGF